MDVINQNENKIICKLLKLHLVNFYDNIYVPFKFFQKNNWNINKVLVDNADALFYCAGYLSETDKIRFNQVFGKYLVMIQEIFAYRKLSKLLKAWTNMNNPQWFSTNDQSYLKSILNDDQYHVISPVIVIKLYYSVTKKYRQDQNKIKVIMTKKLNHIISQYREARKEFQKRYHRIVTKYVYLCPLDFKVKREYVKLLLNETIMAILDLSEKLIDLKIYGIHSLITNLISYTPIDEINNPSEAGVKIAII